jgi:hypothetical protein
VLLPKRASPLIRLVAIEFVIGRKRPVTGGQALKRRLAPVSLLDDQRPFDHIDDIDFVTAFRPIFSTSSSGNRT